MTDAFVGHLMREVNKYSFDGPMAIRFYVYQSEFYFRVEGIMSTMNRDPPHSKIDIKLSRNLDRRELNVTNLKRSVELTVTEIIREMTTHERDEWFKYEGKRVNDPHE